MSNPNDPVELARAAVAAYLEALRAVVRLEMATAGRANGYSWSEETGDAVLAVIAEAAHRQLEDSDPTVTATEVARIIAAAQPDKVSERATPEGG